MPKRIYLAGSFDDQTNWRKDFKDKLKNKFIDEIIGIDPFERQLNEDDPVAKVGHDMFCIKNSDLIIVNSVKSKITMGTAQEIILAKYWNKPVIIITDEESGVKFKERISKNGQTIKNYIHPFAFNFSDVIVDNYDQAIDLIQDFLFNEKPIKSFQNTLLAGEKYEKEIFPTDFITQKFFNQSK